MKSKIFLTGLAFSLLCITGICDAQDETSKKNGVTLIEETINSSGIEEALKIFTKIKSDEGYVFADNDFINLAYTFLQSEKPHEASQILEMGLELSPSSANILLFLSTAYYQNNEPDKALTYIKKRFDTIADFTLERFNKQNEGKLLSSADEVIQKYIEATGGEENWKSIQTMKVTFQMQPTGETPLEMVRLYKRPNLYSQGVVGSNKFNSTNGKKTWNFNGKEWKETKTKYRTSSIDNYVIDHANYGVKYEFIGLDVLNYNPVYHLKRIFADSFTQDLYFSAESFLLQEIKSDYIEAYPFIDSYFSLWDYREIEGIRIPYVFIRNMGPLGPPHGGVITDVQINIPLSDSSFLPPELISKN